MVKEHIQGVIVEAVCLLRRCEREEAKVAQDARYISQDWLVRAFPSVSGYVGEQSKQNDEGRDRRCASRGKR